MNGWTAERRRRQSELIRSWRPWERSTGPRTPAGKAAVARDAYSGGVRPLLRELAQALRQQRHFLQGVGGMLRRSSRTLVTARHRN
jgi:hypothetical protein